MTRRFVCPLDDWRSGPFEIIEDDPAFIVATEQMAEHAVSCHRDPDQHSTRMSMNAVEVPS